MKTLRYGSRNSDVKKLQKLLNKRLHPSPNLTTDGIFGSKSERTVRQYQAWKNLSIDGIVGFNTWQALQGKMTPRPVEIPPGQGNFSDAPWMAIALQEKASEIREIQGSEHNSRIIEYHSTTGGATTDEAAWCASFVNWCLLQANIQGKNSAWAASWLNWGRATNSRRGAITVLYNTTHSSGSGNHVGFLLRETGTYYQLLGGNQSNRVKISTYRKPQWQLKGYRWPIS